MYRTNWWRVMPNSSAISTIVRRGPRPWPLLRPAFLAAVPPADRMPRSWMFLLANAYRTGAGVPRNDRRAVELYESAGEREHPAHHAPLQRREHLVRLRLGHGTCSFRRERARAGERHAADQSQDCMGRAPTRWNRRGGFAPVALRDLVEDLDHHRETDRRG